ncbi:DUF1681 domain containing protein [Nitzschia inconspicua]|uniref:DUF1681 domain containing protein n=1 Tax=Nitzschia inconspicua TaxID=303405 RepID=A0A9K3KTC7_9STRA|nr:DUF1681 domain containing protein [Nitzschia inconspicua]
MTSHSINAGQETTTGSLLRQTLMTHDECFVYKVPPLATASGYRANEWNLAQPLQTCGFQVERRDNDLYLLFTLENHTKLFAVSKITDGENVQRSVEPVLDSSRYFVTKISQQQQPNNRTALLGFGFRDRDVAIDLLGNLQQFQKSIQRELQAKTMKVTEIPTLKQGDKIHINLPTKGNNATTTTTTTDTASHRTPRKKAATTTPTTNAGGSGPFLLKKPPPPPPSTDGGAATVATTTTTTSPTSMLSSPQVPQVVVNLSEMEVPPEPMELDDQGDGHNNNNNNKDDAEEASQEEEDSEGAVAKSIIYDFEDIVDDGLEESGLPKVDNDNKDDDDDEDFGDFQGA